jgi:hypothetical protein
MALLDYICNNICIYGNFYIYDYNGRDGRGVRGSRDGRGYRCDDRDGRDDRGGCDCCDWSWYLLFEDKNHLF